MAWVKLDSIVTDFFEAVDPMHYLLHDITDDDAIRETQALLDRVIVSGFGFLEDLVNYISHKSLRRC
jgi:hypothetical protein